MRPGGEHFIGEGCFPRRIRPPGSHASEVIPLGDHQLLFNDSTQQIALAEGEKITRTYRDQEFGGYAGALHADERRGRLFFVQHFDSAKVFAFGLEGGAIASFFGSRPACTISNLDSDAQGRFLIGSAKGFNFDFGSVEVWTTDGEFVRSIQSPETGAGVSHASFVKGTTDIVAACPHAIQVFDLEGNVRQTIPTDDVHAPHFVHAAGDVIVAASQWSGAIDFYEDGRLAKSHEKNPRRLARSVAAGVSHDGRHAVLAGREEVFVYTMAGVERRSFRRHLAKFDQKIPAEPRSVAMRGDRVFLGTDDAIEIYDLGAVNFAVFETRLVRAKERTILRSSFASRAEAERFVAAKGRRSRRGEASS